MTLLQGNSTLQANALLANMAADVKTTPELSAHVQKPETDDGKPVQLQLFE